MIEPIQKAASYCKTIMRNGSDAYVISPTLQQRILEQSGDGEVEICTDLDLQGLTRLFPEMIASPETAELGSLSEEGILFRFYSADIEDSSHPEGCVAKLTPRLMQRMEGVTSVPSHLACAYMPRDSAEHDGFEDFSLGRVKLAGIPDETLKQGYLRAIRALRYAANYNLPVEENTWLAVVRGARRVIDYVSISDIMAEWRKVEAENMWKFVDLLFDSMILHGLIPELAALSRVSQNSGPDQSEETVWEHTVKMMRLYPEELPYDWYGVMACLFHDVGKLYTGEKISGEMTFFQHHQVGAKVTRKIAKRLRLEPGEVDLLCHLVRHHMRFHFMLNDKGIRLFKALDEYPRLIELARADIKSREGKYTEFNHNMKMLERADIAEDLLEPLLNGQEIMELTGINPGPTVGLIRDALLQAQVAGDVDSPEGARSFVLNYKKKEKLQ
jgi:poly(A) polymerase